MSKNWYYYNFPTTNKIPKQGEVWIAKFPYKEKGGFEKIRPVLVIYVDEENEKFICKSFTTNKLKGKKPKGNIKKFNKEPYITNNIADLSLDKFYRRLCRYEKESEFVYSTSE